MPTVRWIPRGPNYPFFYRSLERHNITECISAMSLCISALMRSLVRDRRQGGQPRRRGKKYLMMILGTVLAATALDSDLLRKRQNVYYPSAGCVTHGVNSDFWNANENIFISQFRFRIEHFKQFLNAMQLGSKEMRVGRKGRQQFYPADICMMVVLRRLATPCRFVDLVNLFGIPSNRLCDIFHSTIDFLYQRYAKKICDFETWKPHFGEFAALMTKYGSLFRNLAGLTDGNWCSTCRPGGLGNLISQMDQSELYSGKEACHGMKFLACLFPNGMSVLSGPYKGKVHDGRMMREARWMEILRLMVLNGEGDFCLFGDAGFALSHHLQVMHKHFMTKDGRRFNALMSRIRIHIENAFAGQGNVFNFLGFSKGLRLGGRNMERLYIVATFLMNVRTTFYGNQFTHALNHELTMTVEELLSMAVP